MMPEGLFEQPLHDNGSGPAIKLIGTVTTVQIDAGINAEAISAFMVRQ